ncbi:DegT/DnrJ/EryC1/StrS family aminotransferase [Methylobacterium isbiliense]|uniref:GDP-perosamine synthase n=1 Tax=Methylobacterium isbiliense TaxID=315478 RepID=A0ABQ4SNV7_9HYPH|nr:DegT/DnrJ/EryC1/StrS family aminotransferase [Methylobacterium isbiliense]MDN3625930.1 DegT/DnrJ/EryC1/StrS family aminotransferase [Methylobacterium isbiliense]GJE04195.1 GDP-perosamine synthase [Methylobacterium isbiliense]
MTASLSLSRPAADVPLSLPNVSEREAAYAAQALASGDIGPAGAFRDRFEAIWAARNGTAHAITLSSGTAALHVALASLGIGPGDEVIVPATTYVASANAVLHAGGRPIFVDVDPDTFCIDPAAAGAAVTARTRAIMPVHLFGHPCPMDALWEIARGRRIALVADGAHAPLAGYRGMPLAAAATVTTHSFFQNKILSCGEGGALLTNDPDLIVSATQLRAHGLGLDGRQTYHRLGYNYRLTNLACAILCAQEERADAILARHAELDRSYRQLLASHPRITLQTIRDWAQPVHWFFPLVLPNEAPGTHRVIARLSEDGIGARPFFPSLDTIPHLSAFQAERPQPLTTARRLAERGLLLPLRATMSDIDVERVVEALLAAVR